MRTVSKELAAMHKVSTPTTQIDYNDLQNLEFKMATVESIQSTSDITEAKDSQSETRTLNLPAKNSQSETRTHNLPVNSRARCQLRHPGYSYT